MVSELEMNFPSLGVPTPLVGNTLMVCLAKCLPCLAWSIQNAPFANNQFFTIRMNMAVKFTLTTLVTLGLNIHA